MADEKIIRDFEVEEEKDYEKECKKLEDEIKNIGQAYENLAKENEVLRGIIVNMCYDKYNVNNR